MPHNRGVQPPPPPLIPRLLCCPLSPQLPSFLPSAPPPPNLPPHRASSSGCGLPVDAAPSPPSSRIPSPLPPPSNGTCLLPLSIAAPHALVCCVSSLGGGVGAALVLLPPSPPSPRLCRVPLQSNATLGCLCKHPTPPHPPPHAHLPGQNTCAERNLSPSTSPSPLVAPPPILLLIHSSSTILMAG